VRSPPRKGRGPVVAAQWRAAYLRGDAGKACDLIVRATDPPPLLMAALRSAPCAAVADPVRPWERQLTLTERAILQKASQGLTRPQQAAALGLTRNAVHAGWERIFRHLRAPTKNQRAAVRLAAARYGYPIMEVT